MCPRLRTAYGKGVKLHLKVSCVIVVWCAGPLRLQNWEAQTGGAQPGMTNSAAALFDALTGTYVPKPLTENPFCTGQSHLP
jgi:hypothetical protein